MIVSEYEKIRTQLNGFNLWLDEIREETNNGVTWSYRAILWLDSNNDIVAYSSWSITDAFEKLLEKLGE